MSPGEAQQMGRDSVWAQSQEESRRRTKGRDDSQPVRIIFANVAGIPLDPLNNKNGSTQNWIQSSNADIIGMAETNICWHQSTGGPIQERLKMDKRE